MSEVLKFEYHAGTDSFIGEVDAVLEHVAADGTTRRWPVVGVQNPVRHMTMAKLESLDAQLAADLRSVLARLEPVLRTTSDEDASDPEAMRKEAARIARVRQALLLEQEAHKAGVEERVRTIADLEEKIRVKRKEAEEAEAGAAVEKNNQNNPNVEPDSQ